LRAGITTSCRSGDTRYTRLNLLGWAMLCPHAVELLWHGSTPLAQPGYPTADESRKLHSMVMGSVMSAVESLDARLLSVEREYQHTLGFTIGDARLCALSKADIVYTMNVGGRLFTLYVEVSSARINVAKPWQALLRAIALYYERRTPVGIAIVSPGKIMYKLLEDKDQDKVLERIRGGPGRRGPSPDLCSLCELQHYCPYRVI